MITESPRNIAAPITPSSSTSGVRRPSARVASAVSESVPPSPLLSARSRISTYLIVTTTISAHRIIDSTPSTVSRVTGPDSDGRHHRLAERVERAGADVAIDDADAAERQRPEACAGRTSARGRVRPRRSASPATSLMDRESAFAATQQGARVIHPPPENNTAPVTRCANMIRETQGLKLGRKRRRLAHQGDGHAAVGGDERIVGEQRLGVGPAGHHEEAGRPARPPPPESCGSHWRGRPTDPTARSPAWPGCRLAAVWPAIEMRYGIALSWHGEPLHQRGGCARRAPSSPPETSSGRPDRRSRC